MTMTDEETRDPEAVLRQAAAEREWATWHPGDGTQYRVKLVYISGGPDDTDRLLLVGVGGRYVAVRFSSPGVADYRAEKWDRNRWKREQLDPPGGYDWWPDVIKPLLKAAGAT